MRRAKCYGLLFFLLLAGRVVAGSETPPPEPVTPPTPPSVLSMTAAQSDWVFFGAVSNESGERYNYYFQLQRDKQQFHITAALIDAETNTLVLFEEGDGHQESVDSNQWTAGRAFLRFNAINNTWVFGVKNKQKRKFNFKVDMFGLEDKTPAKQQELRKGIELHVMQTGRLNGHLQAGEKSKEQFVTAKSASFRQLWVSKPQPLGHPLTAILCEFNDGSGFYSVNLNEPDALQGAVAGWHDAKDEAVPMSQFVSVNAATDSTEGLWTIHVLLPKLNLSLTNLIPLENQSTKLVLGRVKGGMPGFCAINWSKLGETATV